MREQIENAIREITAPHADSRTHCLAIHIQEMRGNFVALEGRALNESDLASFSSALGGRFPGLSLDTASITILRRPGNPTLRVATNLTGLYDTPRFLNPLTSELVYGTPLEILQEQGRWVFTRQPDGYLGWAYRPYLSADLQPEATHLVIVPALEVRAAPQAESPIVTRLMSGTPVHVQDEANGWARVHANAEGWVNAASLRPLAALPHSTAERRAQIVADSGRMVGVPYLWGGNTGNGIDCSGFARLLHQWAGVSIPRDADMQHAVARPVVPPFQPGDLLFFAEGDEKRAITHVGVSLGGWKMIHSSRSRNGVYVDDVQEKPFLTEIFHSAGTFLG